LGLDPNDRRGSSPQDDRQTGRRAHEDQGRAVLRELGSDFEITEMDLDPPKTGEVLMRWVAAGLCHSDEHLQTGDIPVRYPIVGGHEGAGIVEEVGTGVTRLKPGDHVVCSFSRSAGHCRFCSPRHDQHVRPGRAPV
jgi:Zn-dependent alcohol dehydrogenase